MFFSISARSMSMWIIFLPWQKMSLVAQERSENLVPTAISRSVSVINLFAAVCRALYYLVQADGFLV